MSRKVFNAGEILTASDVNNFLMDQSVMSFASAAARTTAIPSPVEGMVTWLEDVNRYDSYNGTAWVPLVPESQGNAIINGAFDIWQRGTSIGPISSVAQYVADRWYGYLGSTPYTFSRQATSLTGFQFGLRMQRPAGNTGIDSASQVVSPLETINSIPFAGKTVNLSFYARAGANFSSGSNALGLSVRSGTGTDQRHNAYTGAVDFIAQNLILTTSWQRFSYSGAVPTNSTELAIIFTRGATGTAGADDWFEVTGVQLEAGPVATPFRRNANSLEGELAACQRYYVRFGGDDLFQFFGSGIGATTTRVNAMVQLPVPMRVKPTSIDFATPLAVQQNAGGAVIAAGTPTLAVVYTNRFNAGLEVPSTGIVVGSPYWFLSNNSFSGSIGFSAEL
jgi:hypothetical protein